MIKKRCKNCNKKIEKKFNYCPWCGLSFKQEKERLNFGMIGRKDNKENPFGNELKLPFGLNRIMGGLLKQLENEFQTLGKNQQGVKIKILRGMPGQMKQMPQPQIIEEKAFQPEKVSEKEQEKRSRLKEIDAESVVKRLGDTIIYEITAPGIIAKKDVAIINLEQGIQIKIYTKDICYTKTIPLKIEITNLAIKKDKLIVEMKG